MEIIIVQCLSVVAMFGSLMLASFLANEIVPFESSVDDAAADAKLWAEMEGVNDTLTLLATARMARACFPVSAETRVAQAIDRALAALDEEDYLFVQEELELGYVLA